MEIRLICSLLLCAIVYSCRTPNLTTAEPQLQTPIVNEINSNEQLIDTIIVDDSEQNRYEEVVRIDTIKECYETAYRELEAMLSGRQKLDFKRAVFITENAYTGNAMSYSDFCSYINFYSKSSDKLSSSLSLKNYPFSDSVTLKKNYAIYTMLKDTVTIKRNTYLPIEYNFDQNTADWSNTFVSYIFSNGKGTCHSLPYLYKIIANELGAECYLSLAPNHLYLKHRSKRLGWYNTELTSGQFPTDAWVKASGYVTLDAIRNGIYMDTLGQNQNIALCVYDLAMGYSQKCQNSNSDFIIKCCDLVLKTHPQNINAIILKAETLKKDYETFISVGDVENANIRFGEMKQLYVLGINLGYREMPKEMYQAWLASSVDASEKFKNTSILSTFNITTK